MEVLFSRDRAAELGYTIEVKGQSAVWYKNGEEVGQAEGYAPLFTALANIAEREGEGFVVGYGGENEATPAFIESISGETGIPD